MKRIMLEKLRCPKCLKRLDLTESDQSEGEVHTGHLTCMECAATYPIVKSIPRFVPVTNYANNFGFQWNRFAQTQLDSHSGHSISSDRFFAQSGWSREELRDKWVLDVGCGAGRFAEIALSCGANVVALDYSGAVEACYKNLVGRGAIHVVQGSVYELPFAPQQFDYVYCFGVLQHTPDVKKTLQLLPQQLRARGKLAVDVYPKLKLNAIWPKYWVRPLTRHIPPQILFTVTKWTVRVLLPVSLLLGRIPVVGRKLRYMIPVVNYEGVFPLSRAQIREWAVLDTFDMYSARHDQPQDVPTIESWLRDLDVDNIDVFRDRQVIGRAIRCEGKDDLVRAAA